MKLIQKTNNEWKISDIDEAGAWKIFVQQRLQEILSLAERGKSGTPIEAQVKMESIEMQAKSAIEALKPGFLRQTNPFTNFKI
jgi:hypothetical protein|tara:strand:+ start:4661 stop:4909 length:249 start_codon:yes stop_codon:yes gene_type:complete